MELEQQTTSLELSKKLKELGVKQKSLWRWYRLRWQEEKNRNSGFKNTPDRWEIESEFERLRNDESSYWHSEEEYSAFTVAELGEKLPVHLTINDKFFDLIMIKNPTEFGVRYENSETIAYIGTENGGGILKKTEANARGKMLAYLIENKLIK